MGRLVLIWVNHKASDLPAHEAIPILTERSRSENGGLYISTQL
jgi:hypothetical protein